MKTSFYFVLWIVIYPILYLFNNSFIDNNAFIFALIIVAGISWLTNKMMPKIIVYERFSQSAPMLEDVYTGNVSSFLKRLSRDFLVEAISVAYFVITFIVIILTILKSGVNDWIALIIFGIFSFGVISRCLTIYRAKSELKSEPTPEKCMEIAEGIYKLDYASFYEYRQRVSYEELLSRKPRYFKVFKVFSIVMAGIATILGFVYFVIGILVMISQNSLESGAVAGMYLLYGSLAAYFGVKDFISCISKK